VQLIGNMTEELFRKMLGENQMATDKLAEGVTKFAADQDKCEARIAEKAAEWGLALV
jgi:transaldolase